MAITLDILIGIAGLLVKEMAVERAVELLTLVLEHPSSEQESKDWAKRILAESESDLPPLVVAAAQASGGVRLLEEVATELLDHSDWRELVKQ